MQSATYFRNLYIPITIPPIAPVFCIFLAYKNKIILENVTTLKHVQPESYIINLRHMIHFPNIVLIFNMPIPYHFALKIK